MGHPPWREIGAARGGLGIKGNNVTSEPLSLPRVARAGVRAGLGLALGISLFAGVTAGGVAAGDAAGGKLFAGSTPRTDAALPLADAVRFGSFRPLRAA